MSKEKTDEFKYPCIHSTPKSGVRYMYSSLNDKGHFNVPKIIFGETGIYNSVIDINGKYGLTNGCIGIEIENLKNGENYNFFLESSIMTDIIKSCSFSSFRVDWNIFKEFKKDFWKEFIDEESKEEYKEESKEEQSNIPSISSLTLSKLKDIARQFKISGFSNKKKTDLITLLNNASNTNNELKTYLQSL